MARSHLEKQKLRPATVQSTLKQRRHQDMESYHARSRSHNSGAIAVYF
jgi:hypothetical protein